MQNLAYVVYGWSLTKKLHCRFILILLKSSLYCVVKKLINSNKRNQQKSSNKFYDTSKRKLYYFKTMNKTKNLLGDNKDFEIFFRTMRRVMTRLIGPDFFKKKTLISKIKMVNLFFVETVHCTMLR